MKDLKFNPLPHKDYFSDAEGNRTLLISKARYDSEEDIRQVLEMGMEQGIDETLDRLDDYLQSLR